MAASYSQGIGSSPRITGTIGFADHADNAPELWSYGHRNVQDAAHHPQTGELWTVGHGPHGGDELNRAQPGDNHGWPEVPYGIEYRGEPVNEGITKRQGMVQPVYYWDPVIAPAGMVFYAGDRPRSGRATCSSAGLKPSASRDWCCRATGLWPNNGCPSATACATSGRARTVPSTWSPTRATAR